MRFRSLILAGLLVVATAVTASAGQGGYFGLHGGINQFHDSDITTYDPYYGSLDGEISYDSGGTLGATIGYDFGGFRLEGEYAYRSAEADKVTAYGYSEDLVDTSVDITSFMANALVDFKPGAPVTPFLGVGLGILKGDLDGDKDTQPGYQLTAGVAFEVTPTLTLDGMYRYQATFSEFEGENAGDTLSYGSSNFLFNARFKF